MNDASFRLLTCTEVPLHVRVSANARPEALLFYKPRWGTAVPHSQETAPLYDYAEDPTVVLGGRGAVSYRSFPAPRPQE